MNTAKKRVRRKRAISQVTAALIYVTPKGWKAPRSWSRVGKVLCDTDGRHLKLKFSSRDKHYNAVLFVNGLDV
jgi:transcription initiation factor TFIIIB Brf1 subunit/transcription initiation factor TFIIB